MESYSVTSIICPNCETALDASDDVCHQCGARTTCNVASNDRPHVRLIDRPWLLIVVVLHVGVLGIPMYWKTKYTTSVRLAIIGASIAYTVFAVAIIYWAGKYLIDIFRMLAS